MALCEVVGMDVSVRGESWYYPSRTFALIFTKLTQPGETPCGPHVALFGEAGAASEAPSLNNYTSSSSVCR